MKYQNKNSKSHQKTYKHKKRHPECGECHEFMMRGIYETSEFEAQSETTIA